MADQQFEVRYDGKVALLAYERLFLRGDLRVVDGEGNVVRTATRMALCRCGHSRNKPYCDLSHEELGFTG